MRASWTSRAKLWFGTRTGGFVGALVVGDSALLGRSLKSATRELGILHLFAASGMNVAFMLELVKPLSRKRGKSLVFGLLALSCYLELTQSAPSMIRASAMAIYVLLGRLIWKKPISGVLCLVIPLGFLTIWQPQIWSQLGFRLSAAATAGIVLWRSARSRSSQAVLLGGFASGWWGALRTGAIAQLWVTPLLLATIHETSPIGIIMTAAIAWICEPLFRLAVPLLLVDSVLLGLGIDLAGWRVVLMPVSWPIDWLLQGIALLGNWSWPVIAINYWTQKYTLIWYLVLLGVTLGRHYGRHRPVTAQAVWRLI